MLPLGHPRLVLNHLPMRRCSDLWRRAGAKLGAKPPFRQRSAFWAMAGAWSLATILSSRALAAGPAASAIVLAFDAGSDAQGQVVTAIRAHMSGLPVEVVTVSVEPGHALNDRLATSGALAASRHALGTFDIEVGEGDSLLIFFTEADGETTLIRRLPPSKQGARVAFEQAAIVVRSLVEALLDGGSVGIAPGAEHSFEPESERPAPREASPPPTSAPAASDQPASEPTERPPEERSTNEQLAITAGYSATQFAVGVPWQSGFSVGAQWLATPVLYAGVRYTFFPALTLASADAAFSIERHPLEVLMGYREKGRLALNAELGIITDRVTRTTDRTAATLRATSPDARWVFAFAPRGGFSWSPWKPVRASMRVGADFVLTRYSYNVESGESLLSPAWVRPRVELELAAGLW
jgi:hypothetical protein